MKKGSNTYPPNWDEIAKTIKDQADWHCENCYHPHDPPNGYMLGVHHLDGNKANCTYENLVALCQRCHLNHDRPRHITQRRASARRREQIDDMIGPKL